MATKAENTVSETIADGFKAVRRASGPELEAISKELLSISHGHEGIKLPYFAHSSDGKRNSRVSISSNQQVGQNPYLWHLARATVYKTMEGLPALDGKFTVTATGISDEDEALGSSPRFIAVGFDKVSAEEILAENDCIRDSLADMARVPLKALRWIPLRPELVLAYASQEVPDEVLQEMQRTVKQALDFDFTLQKAELLPRLGH